MCEKNIKKKNSLKKSSKKGFTLIEILVATFVFVLIMTASSGIFLSMITAIRKSRDLQHNVEGAQLALNEIPKTLRTSVIKAYSDDTITIFDNSRTVEGCITYQFDPVSFAIKRGATNQSASDCDGITVPTLYSMVDVFVDDMKFKVFDGGVGGVPRVTISALVCSQTPCAADSEKVYIQSTVSVKSGN